MQLDPLIFRLIADASQYTSVVKGAEVDLKNLAGAVSGVERAEAALARARAASASVSSRQNDLAAQAIDAQKLAQEQTKAASAAKLLADNRLAAANATGNVDKITAAQRAVARAEIEGIRAAAAERRSQGLLSGLVGSQGQIAEQAERNLNAARLNLARANLNRIGVLEKAIVDSSSEAHRRGSEVAWSYWNTFWGRMLGAAAIFGLTGGIAGAAKTAVELAVDYERAAVSFEVMAGSAEKGRAVLEGINKLAVESPFRSSELVKEAKQLAAFSFKDDQIIPTLRVLGDVASGTGVDMGRLSLALGQVNVIGRLMGQELRQFTNAGVPLIKYLALAMGEAEDRIPQLVRQGMVGFNDVAKAMNLMTKEGGLFHGMMERINKETVYGRWQNFVETLEITGRRLAGAAMSAFGVRDALTGLTTLFSGITDESANNFFKGLVGTIQFLALLGRKAVEELTPLWDMLTTPELPEWLESVAVGVGTTTAALAPFVVTAMAAGTAIGIISVGLYTLRSILRLTGIEFVALRIAVFSYTAAKWGLATANGVVYGSFIALRLVVGSFHALIVLLTSGMAAARIAFMTFAVAATTVSAATSAFTAISGFISAVATGLGPVGMFAVAMGAIAAALHQLGAFDGIFDFLGSAENVAALNQIKDTFLTIWNLIKGGDLESAWKLSLKGIEAAWEVLLINLEASWTRFVGNLRKMFSFDGGSFWGSVLKGGADFTAMMERNNPFNKKTQEQIEELRNAEYQKIDAQMAAASAKYDQETQTKVNAVLEKLKDNPILRSLEFATSLEKAAMDVPAEFRDMTRALVKNQGMVKTPLTAGLEGLMTQGYENIDRMSPETRMMLNQIRGEDRSGRFAVLGGLAGDERSFLSFEESTRTNARNAAFVMQNSFLALREGIAKGLPQEEIDKLRGDFVKKARSLKEIMDPIDRLRKEVADLGRPVGETGISILPKVGANTLKYIQDMEREMVKTGEPFEQFIKHLGMVKEALEGPKGALAASGLLGFGAASQVWKGIIEDSEAGELRFREFEKLRNAVAKNNQDKVAPGAVVGSSAAQDIINRNQMIVRGTQEEILDVLREANRMSQEANTRRQQIVDKLNQLVSEDSPLVTGTFKGR